MSRPQRLRDAWSGECHYCGRPFEFPCHLGKESPDGITIPCPHQCGASLMIQWRRPESDVANPPAPTPVGLVGKRTKLIADLSYQVEHLRSCRNHPQRMAQIYEGLRQIESEIALIDLGSGPLQEAA